MPLDDTADTLVLTYNVCWEAMTHTSGRGSCGPMCQACPIVPGHEKLTECALNMAHCIDGLPSRLGVPNYAFVGLQEASRFWELTYHAPRTLGRMEAVHGKSRQETIACYYDPERYYLAHEPIESALSGGRPFQILICAETEGDGGVIFVNVHNGHGREYGFDLLTEKLSEAIQWRTLSEAERAYRVIVTGDFNEAGWDWSRGVLTTRSWRPFAQADIQTEVHIGPDQPFSCCQNNTGGNWNAPGGGIAKGNRAGDYVFDSHAPAKVQIPPSFDPAYTQSDHLPVMALLGACPGPDQK
ncbi:endonuclease/exonuclease/phosphatase family protein [Tateyamaria omphalii]|uniref:Endonuclease/exonuclease/phosphatase domain-containing protein n=1 Tax=Tateyamaria omphalii TaxID=299262 RepID=A0A1P8MSF4_9RHOB|nr:endonuclease/exonuclease/phosphatase family protein [Tateyamaria omphalii]APX10964.1 hypothetical protein BWR18_04105 [Tateyamaria omphalii]